MMYCTCFCKFNDHGYCCCGKCVTMSNEDDEEWQNNMGYFSNLDIEVQADRYEEQQKILASLEEIDYGSENLPESEDYF